VRDAVGREARVRGRWRWSMRLNAPDCNCSLLHLCRRAAGSRLQGSTSMTPASPRPRALIVDDDPEIADVLRELVEREGFAVTCASSIAQAREEMAATVPDILLVDIQLPYGSGVELLQGLGPADPEVVLITGQA